MLSSNGATTRLGDHIDLLAGFAFPSGRFTEQPSDVRLVRGANIGQGALKWEQERRWPSAEVADLGRYQLDYDDLVLAMDRPWVGAGLKWAPVRSTDLPALLVQRVARLRARESIDRDFLRCLIGGPHFSGYIQGVVTGVNIPHISAAQIEAFEFALPDMATQRRVGALVRAQDELIENNRRRIEILEEMARLLYREWFVHFRFPGHEDVDLVDSELGPIPDGWEVIRLGDFAAYINRGISPKYDDEAEDLVVNQRCIRDGRLSLDNARRHVKKVPPDKRLRRGDVLINSTGVGTLGRVAPLRIEIEQTTADSHVTIVRPPDEDHGEFFASMLLGLQPVFEAMGVGSTGQTELARARIADVVVRKPPVSLVRQFDDQVAPLAALQVNLTQQNRVLRGARDLLLPRLVSGELDVSELDLEGILS